MPLVVEDGSGNSAANAYISLDYCDDFHDVRGNTKWTGASPSQKNAAIVRATEYIDKRFGQNFRGEKMLFDQALEWPRLDAYDNSDHWLQDVPVAVKKACAEYALRALIYTILAPDPTRPTPSQSFEIGETSSTTEPTVGSKILAQETEVGSIRKSVKYGEASTNKLTANLRNVQNGVVNDFNIPEYPEADMWLASVLRNNLTTPMVRA